MCLHEHVYTVYTVHAIYTMLYIPCCISILYMIRAEEEAVAAPHYTSVIAAWH